MSAMGSITVSYGQKSASNGLYNSQLWSVQPSAMVSYSQLWLVQQSAMVSTTAGYGQLQSAMVSYSQLWLVTVSYGQYNSQLWSVQQ